MRFVGIDRQQFNAAHVHFVHHFQNGYNISGAFLFGIAHLCRRAIDFADALQHLFRAAIGK
ncbi:hypothetical protein SDC9_165917 [bioreactor metagenome]|uniref:Uncharacterized protein n=1 Tax=bioreactor metagenome TaxID=1076179 RepID=A0A645FVT0_9ZZZZ